MTARQEPTTAQSRIAGSNPLGGVRLWQTLSGEWTDDRFPGDTLERRGLMLGEETGEVLRCIVKAKQQVRGGEAVWMAKLPDEMADVFFCLTAMAHRAGIDLADAIADRWAELQSRTYPVTASEVEA